MFAYGDYLMDGGGMPEVKFRVLMKLDISARDFADAAEHQSRIERAIGALRDAYPDLVVSVKGVRASSAAPTHPPERLKVHTGRLNAYE
jgi:hypothetical protein